jgi:hypothetical protein
MVPGRHRPPGVAQVIAALYRVLRQYDQRSAFEKTRGAARPTQWGNAASRTGAAIGVDPELPIAAADTHQHACTVVAISS